jgi:D-alanyl-D-alanine carboxypeptidase/D-alanyl-D-alanine-endopeptidase (penicillin-binding protein 4)
MAHAKLTLRRFALAAWLFAIAAAAAHAALPAPVAQALRLAGIPDSAVALYVQDTAADRPVIAHNSDRAFNPASTMKLVTTYAALDLLGPAYTWSTEVYATAPIVGDTLNGDLVIKGYGDPKLTLENFWLMLRSLRARGLEHIRGDVVLDRSFFSVGDYDPAAFDGEPLRPYNTGPDALLVNFKSIAVQFMPSADTRSVRIAAEPPLPGIGIVNAVQLTGGACGDWVSKLRVAAEATGDAARLMFGGTYALDCAERTRSFSLLDHRAFVAAVFSELWRELGDTISGTVRDGRVPAGARLITSATSEALSAVVRDINKYSNNVMARQVFLTLGALGGGAPGTLDKAREVVREWSSAKGIAASELTVDNGSGLSREGRVSARTLAALLLDAFRSPVMPELMASLPVVAVDGTMRKRLGNADIAGHAHIKTGSLAGARAIAGYVLDAHGRRMVVAFLVNHPNAAAARAAQDALLKWVYRRGR